jgi:uncharacterized protein
MSQGKPVPAPDPVSRGYWEAAQEHRLAIQRCRDCARFQHPPYPFCSTCKSEDLEFADVQGRGRIVSFVVMRDSPIPGYSESGPFVFAVIELEEQDHLYIQTNILGLAGLDLEVGLPVKISWEMRGTFVMPQFELALTEGPR